MIKDKEFTPKELGEKLSVSIKTINNFLNNGTLVGYKIGRCWRIPVDSVEEFLMNSNRKIYKEDGINEWFRIEKWGG